jgi:hypothetical protein
LVLPHSGQATPVGALTTAVPGLGVKLPRASAGSVGPCASRGVKFTWGAGGLCSAGAERDDAGGDEGVSETSCACGTGASAVAARGDVGLLNGEGDGAPVGVRPTGGVGGATRGVSR